MTQLLLYQRVAPHTALRFWVGAFGYSSAPDLDWRADGEPVELSTVRPLQGARTTADPGDTQVRVFSGVYELPLPAGSTSPRVLQVGASETAEFTLRPRSLPTTVDAVQGGALRVMILSCFDWREDRAGRAGRLIGRIPASRRPHFSVLMGDQVYLDLPTLANFRKKEAWLAAKFERDYCRTWQAEEGLREILSAAPSVCLPDDHEYWNNYPNPSPFVENTWTSNGRRNWRRAARALYEAFQQPWPTQPGEPTVIDVAPLSFFLADSRSHREAQRDANQAGRTPQAFDEPCVDSLERWVDRLEAEDLAGVFITGQSLFQAPRTGVWGEVADLQLANHRHYPRVVRALARCPARGRDLLCVTGDLHYGRVVRAGSADSGLLYEVVSSPASLLSTVGADQAKNLWNFVRRLSGRKTPWPRHPNPRPAPAHLAPAVLGGEYPTTPAPDLAGDPSGQRGNQVAILTFRTRGAVIECEITFFPIHRNSWRPARVFRIELMRHR